MPQGRARKRTSIVSVEAYLRGALGIIAVALFAYLGKAYVDGFLTARRAAQEFTAEEADWQEHIAAAGLPQYWILGAKGYGFSVRDGWARVAEGNVMQRSVTFDTRTPQSDTLSAYRMLAEREGWDVVETKSNDRLIAQTPAGGQVLVTTGTDGTRTTVTVFYTIPQ